jgi:F-type H+-transporting ATPase subunit b
VLDSWVRYESQVKQRQQKELAQSIIAKVHKELENPKVLQQILQQSVADVESESSHNSTGDHECFTNEMSLQESSLPRLNRQLL